MANNPAGSKLAAASIARILSLEVVPLPIRGAGQGPVMMLLNGVEIGCGAIEIDDAR